MCARESIYICVPEITWKRAQETVSVLARNRLCISAKSSLHVREKSSLYMGARNFAMSAVNNTYLRENADKNSIYERGKPHLDIPDLHSRNIYPGFAFQKSTRTPGLPLNTNPRRISAMIRVAIKATPVTQSRAIPGSRLWLVGWLVLFENKFNK